VVERIFLGVANFRGVPGLDVEVGAVHSFFDGVPTTLAKDKAEFVRFPLTSCTSFLS